ncbi:hypothetical protein [Variovorax terrae]|uniref:Uncharacterized protein n=1 Tax=Variovorax terrae TaxID=2923278 RepID=A0A9X1W031_9BURK|nr:hypothetical protein [Variovorax terrae]MCJ0765329.1 hypothetical protein [Variovorax terrae]
MRNLLFSYWEVSSMSETIHCNACGFNGVNEDNGLEHGDLMEQLEAGDISYDEYEELLGGTRFSCPGCGSLDTEVSDEDLFQCPACGAQLPMSELCSDGDTGLIECHVCGEASPSADWF